jgi:hypothetical protein
VSQTVSVGGRTNRPGGVPPPAGATKSLSTRDAHVSMIGGALDPATGLTLDWMNTPATATERAPVPPHRSNRPVPDRTAPTAMTRSQAFRRSAPAELARTPHQSRATKDSGEAGNASKSRPCEGWIARDSGRATSLRRSVWRFPSATIGTAERPCSLAFRGCGWGSFLSVEAATVIGIEHQFEYGIRGGVRG